jgi:hypothetical protein
VSIARAFVCALLLLPSGVSQAAPAPSDGPAPDALERTLLTVEDLLARFEETAASHHVLLVNEAAARREGALRLVRLGLRSLARNDAETARLCLGWATSFPGTWWYQGSLRAPLELRTLLDAAVDCETACESMTTCTSGARRDEHASEWETLTRRAAQRPHILANRTELLPDGSAATVLDFVHYPPETYTVTVQCDGVTVASGEIRPGATELRARPALGTYRVTAALKAGDLTHEYRAASLTFGHDGLRLNGAPHVIKACHLAGVETATREGARAVLEDLVARGFNLGVVTMPPLWLVELADQLSFGLAVEPGLSGPDGSCALCCGGAGLSGLQDRVVAHIRRYAEAPAVRMWVASPVLTGNAEAVVESLYALYRQVDVYERPVLYLGPLSTACTARDLMSIPLDAGLDAAARTAQVAEAHEHAARQELPSIAVYSGPLNPATEAAAAEALAQGCVGAVLGEVRLD